MEFKKKYVIGLDFGTDSCRALIVDAFNGHEVAVGVSFIHVGRPVFIAMHAIAVIVSTH